MTLTRQTSPKQRHPRIVLSVLFVSFPGPQLDGRPNLTALDLQIKKLRDGALANIRDGASRMRAEATEIRDTLPDLESWAQKLSLLAEEACTTAAHK